MPSRGKNLAYVRAWKERERYFAAVTTLEDHADMKMRDGGRCLPCELGAHVLFSLSVLCECWGLKRP